MRSLLLLLLLQLLAAQRAFSSLHQASVHPHHPQHPYYVFGKLTNDTVAGFANPTCHTATEYFVSSNVQFQFCIAHDQSYLTNGNSITNLVMVRGFMVTCRILHLLYWMLVTSHTGYSREAYFVDVGANIGCCTMHLAALGLPVISVEPLPDHVAIMMGTLQYNPAFNVELYHGAVSTVTRTIHAKLRSQEANWGNTTVEEVSDAETNFQTLSQYNLDTLIGRRKVALVKIDCEGCEYEALAGARRVLHRIPMIKMELIQPSYRNGNGTATAKDILVLLQEHNFELFMDLWNENPFYNGRLKNKLTHIDQLLGSKRFRVTSNLEILAESARTVLTNPIKVETFDQDAFVDRCNDVIAIRRDVAQRMREFWGVAQP